MKKVIALLILSLLFAPHSNAVEPGIRLKPCPKSQINKIKNGFECKVIEKLYRWVPIKNNFVESKINPVVKPTPIESPSPTPTTKQKIDISGIIVNFVISENAKNRNYHKYTAALNSAIEFWYPVYNKSKVNIILFTEHDGSWIDEKQKDLMGPYLSNPTQQLQSYRLKQHGCAIGGFYMPNIILACIPETSHNDLESYMLLPHEYVHLVGMTSMQISNLPIGTDGRLRPCWVEEGMATFYGMKSASEIDNNFENNKQRFLKNIRITSNPKSYESIVNTMLDLEQTMNTCSKVQDAYFLGSTAFDILYNKYGNEAILKFNKELLGGINWKIAFYNSFNLNVNEFYDRLALQISKS